MKDIFPFKRWIVHFMHKTIAFCHIHHTYEINARNSFYMPRYYIKWSTILRHTHVKTLLNLIFCFNKLTFWQALSFAVDIATTPQLFSYLHIVIFFLYFYWTGWGAARTANSFRISTLLIQKGTIKWLELMTDFVIFKQYPHHILKTKHSLFTRHSTLMYDCYFRN